MLSQVNLSEVPSRPFQRSLVSAMADWPSNSSMPSMNQGFSLGAAGPGHGVARSTAAQEPSGMPMDMSQYSSMPNVFNNDPYDTDRSRQEPPRENSRCDLAQYCPPPPPQFHDTAPFPPTMHSRGGVPVPRTQPPMFADPPPMFHSQAQPAQPSVQQQISRHQRILLFLRHCAKCTDPSRCVYSSRCQSGKQLWSHIFQCSNQHCTYRNCVYSRELLRHYQKCVDKSCPICGPVRSYVADDQGSIGTTPPPF